MPRPFETKLWRLQLPDTWNVSDKCGQELVTFFRPDGVGLLMVFTVGERSPVPGGHGDEFLGCLSGTTYVATYGDKFSRTWALNCRGRRLWVRYTCSAKNAELERLE